MYCPECSAQNETGQKYCRRCGLPLTVIQLAIEGRVDEALAKYRKGVASLSRGTFILALCLFAALINMFLIPGPWNGYAVVANSIVGLVIAVPMIIAGRVRLSRARHVLSSEDQAHHLIEPEAGRTAALSPLGAITDPLVSQIPIPGSVTEQTTLNLKSPERNR
jgi:zinc ribbon protein